VCSSAGWIQMAKRRVLRPCAVVHPANTVAKMEPATMCVTPSGVPEGARSGDCCVPVTMTVSCSFGTALLAHVCSNAQMIERKYRLCCWTRAVACHKEPFKYTFIRSFIHIFIHSHIHSFIHSFMYSFIHIFNQSHIHSFMYSLIHSYIHSHMHSFMHILIN
jgi:hypothetical protein